jgi:Peptidase inhibitor I78 family
MKTPALILVPGFVLALAACEEMKPKGPEAATAEAGTCGAADHQAWVGQSVAVLNDAALPEGARVLFPTTPATMDYRAERLNIAVDKSDKISRVYCG